jgi:hypothetical protein
VVVFAHPPIPAGLSLFICQSAPLNLTSAEIGLPALCSACVRSQFCAQMRMMTKTCRAARRTRSPLFFTALACGRRPGVTAGLDLSIRLAARVRDETCERAYSLAYHYYCK